MGIMDIKKQRLIKQCQTILGEDFDKDFIYEDVDFTKPREVRKAYKTFVEEVEKIEESTDLYQKGKILCTRYSMGKGKGMGLQVNYGRTYIQVPEKDIKALQIAISVCSKKFKQGLKEEVELEEAKRMKYNKVIKKLQDGEWDTSMDVKKRMHLTYTDNNTGKQKVVFVENDDLEESTAEYAKSLEKIANDRKMKNISKKDKETLKKIAALLAKEAYEEGTDELTSQYKKDTPGEIEEKKIAGLVKKAEKSGISYGILKQVYNRGMAAWKTGHRPGTTPQQWAFARVNSFITGGKTRTTADADLWAKRK
jgi:hypothetical protein